jgi:hypothetical protein
VAGRDGTAAFRQIEHHLDPEIEAMLPAYRVGSIRRLEFGAAGTVAIGDGGLAYVPLSDVFRAWVRYLYRVVEVENAVRGDFHALDTVVVGGDPPGAMSFLNARLLLEAHQRLTNVYLPALLEREPRRLWALTTSIVAPGADVRELDRALRCAQSGAEPAAADAAAFVERLIAAGAADCLTRSRLLDDALRLRGPLEQANFTFLAGMKHAVREGVRVFEQFERSTPDRAGTRLLEPLQAIPRLVAELHDATTAAFGQLAVD